MIVGTAGHIDHGKTSLVRALTGVDTDRLKEEKARGITIDLGFAYLPAPSGGVIGFVDVPGHEKFVHNMLAGATGIDFVLMVVAADDGVMPQTREHLAIVDLLGISRGLVALTKADLADAERRRALTADISAALATTELADADIIPVSTVTGEGVEELREALFAAERGAPARGADRRFRLAVDRSFTLQGAGTVVTGTVLSGAVAVGDHLTVSPSGLAVRVRAIHAQNRPAEAGATGERCALNLAGDGVTKDAVHRGDVVLDPLLHAPCERIDATLRVLAGEPRPVGQWMPVRLHHAAAEVAARVVLLGEEAIAPGGDGLVQLVLERPIAAASGDRYVLRDVSAQRTIGGGAFLDPRAPSRKRRTPERLAQLAAHERADPAAALSGLLEVAPFHVNLDAFARDRAMRRESLDRVAADLALVRLPVKDGVIAVSAGRFEALRAAIAAKLEGFHAENPDLAGIGLERLRMHVAPWLPAPAFRAGLLVLVRGGLVALDGAWVRLAGHEVRLAEADALLWREISALLEGPERFRPPRVRDIATARDTPEADIRRVLKLAGRLGWVDEVAHDHFFARASVAEMVEIIRDLSSGSPTGEFSAARFRDQLASGRKVAIQILEFFDRHGVTLRRGDLRRVNRHRLDLFRVRGEEEDAVSREEGRETSPVGRPDFKSGRGREPVPGGFDSHSLPPLAQRGR